MLIRSVAADNFKSFEHLALDLTSFNVLVGSNASGKSNVVDLFQFLRDTNDYGLENAVSMHGGGEYLMNAAGGFSKPLRIATTWLPGDAGSGGIAYDSVYHEFSLRFEPEACTYAVEGEELRVECRVPGTDEVPPARLEFRRAENSLRLVKRPGGTIGEALESLLPPGFDRRSLAPDALAIEQIWFPFFNRPLSLPGGIATYDFDPKLAKRAAPITGKIDLERNGENLALVVRRILARPESRSRLQLLVADVLPFVEELSTVTIAERSLLLSFREKFSAGKSLPSFSVSDGSIQVVALIVALFFTERRFIAIEEPERCIHPSMIGRLSEFFREASARSQVLITTHSPEMLGHFNIEDLLLVGRDGAGFSRVTRPADAETVRVFLANEAGLDDLLVQDLFGVDE